MAIIPDTDLDKDQEETGNVGNRIELLQLGDESLELTKYLAI